MSKVLFYKSINRNLNSHHLASDEKAHVTGRLPLPGKNITKIRVHFFETLYSYEHKMSIKKIFHRWTSELPAKQHSPNQPKWAETDVLLSW